MIVQTPYGTINTARGIDISIPPGFNQEGICLFGAPAPEASPALWGSTSFSVNNGSVVNVDTLTFIPHCHGTHTETAGHLCRTPLPISECMPEALLSSHLITAPCTFASSCKDSLPAKAHDRDPVISRDTLSSLLPENPGDALLIRVLHEENESCPPYFSKEAMQLISDLSIGHLLVTLPSVDRTEDGGLLENHRCYWNMPSGSLEAPEGRFYKRTITELIHVPDSVSDGPYVLSLQVLPWNTDAAPSRPLLFQTEMT